MAKKQIEQTEIEAPYELPEGWKWCKLGDVAEKIKRGKSPKYTESSNVMVFAQKCNQPDGIISLEKSLFLDESTLGKYKESDFTKNGDILINSTGTGTIGRVGFFCSEILEKEKRLVPDSHVTTVRIIDDNCSKLFYYFLKEKENYLSMQGVGTTNMKELHIDVLENMPFPLPPTLEEQQRIVNRIETLFAKLDLAKEKSQNVVETFETRKASILHKAFTGELTKKWREENGVAENSWVEKNLEEVCKSIFAGGDAPKVVSEIRTDKYKYPIYANAAKDFGLYGYTNEASVFENAVTVAARGSGTGLAFRRNEPFLPIVRLIVLIPKESLSMDYLFYSLRNLSVNKSGSAIPQLTVPIIKKHLIKFPSLSEQTEIVRILDCILEKETKAKEAAEAVLEQIDLLKKSILARAFRGEL